MKQWLLSIFGLAVIHRLCFYFLKRTEIIAARSTGELLVWAFQRLFKRRTIMSGFSKTFTGPAGSSVTISESAGEVKIVASEAAAVGGGSIQGAVSVKGSAEIDLEGKMLLDAALAYGASKFPTLSGVFAAAQAGMDAELSKL